MICLSSSPPTRLWSTWQQVHSNFSPHCNWQPAQCLASRRLSMNTCVWKEQRSKTTQGGSRWHGIFQVLMKNHDLCYPEKSVFFALSDSTPINTLVLAFLFLCEFLTAPNSWTSWLWVSWASPQLKESFQITNLITSAPIQLVWFFKRIILSCFSNLLSFPGGSVVKNSRAMQET